MVLQQCGQTLLSVLPCKFNTVEQHKCKDLVIAYGRLSCLRNKPQGVVPRKAEVLTQSTFWQRIYCIQF